MKAQRRAAAVARTSSGASNQELNYFQSVSKVPNPIALAPRMLNKNTTAGPCPAPPIALRKT